MKIGYGTYNTSVPTGENPILIDPTQDIMCNDDNCNSPSYNPNSDVINNLVVRKEAIRKDTIIAGWRVCGGCISGR